MSSHPDGLLALIVEEVDQARDTLQIVDQLRHALPIADANQLLDAFEGGRVDFRDRTYDADDLRPHIPTFIFPIRELSTLVRYAMLVSSILPYHFARDPDDTEQAVRIVQRKTVLTMIPDLSPEFVANSIQATGQTAELVRRIDSSLTKENNL